MARFRQLLFCFVLAWCSSAVPYGPSSSAPPGEFPTSLYKSYYNNPTATSAQPQPVISDPVLVCIYASVCEELDSLMSIYSTRYILPGSPTRKTYPGYVMSHLAPLDTLHHPHYPRPERHQGPPPSPTSCVRRSSLAICPTSSQMVTFCPFHREQHLHALYRFPSDRPVPLACRARTNPTFLRHPM